MKTENKSILSVIIPVSERYDDLAELTSEYKLVLDELDRDYEILYVIDGYFDGAYKDLKAVKNTEAGKDIKLIKLAKRFGEATLLSVGFEQAKGDLILTLPSYYQIDPQEIQKIICELDDNDMVVARRWPRTDSKINQFMSSIFHYLLNLISGNQFKDLGSGVRVFKKVIADEIAVYGDQHRFLPILAAGRGFRVKEINVNQSPKDKHFRIYSAGIYLRRLLDILTILFLVKFTKKPLRFFGLLGTATIMVGGALLLYPIIERVFFGVGLADRPMLLISSLVIVLGVQIFVLGLIGELIIYTHARDIKEYTIEEIIN